MKRTSIDYTARDAAALTGALLDLAREKLPLWTDHSPNDLGVVLLEAVAHLGDMLFYHQDRIANESYLETAIEPRSVVNLLRLIGYELEPSKPASADLCLVFDAGPASEGPLSVTIPHGAEFHTTHESAGDVVRFRYLGPDRVIALGTFEHPAANVEAFESDGRRFLRWGLSAGAPGRELLPVRQVDRRITREIIGSSDASSGQRFALAHAPVIDDSLRVSVIEGQSELEWTRVETLLFSKPDDRHYQVRRDENQRVFVEFGTGTQGRIPAWGVDNIRANYLVGGGSRANVAPNTIVKPGELAASVPGLRRSEHAAAASGGADREALETAAQRAPHQFRAQNRAVTAADYEAHALELGAAKARAFRRPWNRVELYVAPAGGGLPSKTLKEQLLRYLDERRVMTTVIEVKDPEYVVIDIALDLIVEPSYFQDEVRSAASAAVKALFAFDKVDFGQTLHLSKVYEAVEAIDGVDAVHVVRFRPAGASQALPGEGRIQLTERQIPVLSQAAPELDATGGLDRG